MSKINVFEIFSIGLASNLQIVIASVDGDLVDV